MVNRSGGPPQLGGIADPIELASPEVFVLGGGLRPAGWSRRSSFLPSVVVILLAATAATMAVRNHDLSADTTSAWASFQDQMSAVTIPIGLCLVLVSALHYGAAALASRAAAGVRLPFRELMAAQLTASAANRLSPAGLGGAAVIGRYFVRRGGLLPSQAGAAVSALAMLGGIADVVAFAAVVGAGTATGLTGAGGEVPLLASRITGLIPVPTWSWWAAIGISLGVVTVTLLVVLRAAPLTRRLIDELTHCGATFGALMRCPARLAALMTASSCTTLMFAAGFAAAATLGPSGLPAGDFGALMIGYMVAAAAGNALPTPGGIGTADAAFVGVLVASHLPAANALTIVLTFRLITFWAPAAIGLCLARPLRRAGAI